MIEKLPGADKYGCYAYDIAVLKYFVEARTAYNREQSSRHSSKMHHRRRSSSKPGKLQRVLDSSFHSVRMSVRKSLDGSLSSSRRSRNSDTGGSFTTKKTDKLTSISHHQGVQLFSQRRNATGCGSLVGGGSSAIESPRAIAVPAAS